jgi:hypothetical protein
MFLHLKKLQALTFKNLILIKFEIILLGNTLSLKLCKNQNQKFKKFKMIKRVMQRLARAILNLI